MRFSVSIESPPFQYLSVSQLKCLLRRSSSSNLSGTISRCKIHAAKWSVEVEGRNRLKQQCVYEAPTFSIKTNSNANIEDSVLAWKWMIER